ncbi:Tetratricopeptide repeat-containing protein [Aromatoleum tolulyticum]|uniref:Tetratricopeptide repeat-containing protein n=1 Tax=Aromatoleum tolulyticum TaxID=34027 RepID=A0A1N6N2T8_9RHOO|nr:Tetratricopeptide repeat-containing protein [Aromatoleum tolulyticum]
MNKCAFTLKPVIAALVLGACSTTPTMPEKAWKISPVQTVRHGGASADGYFALGRVKEAQGASTQAIDAYRKALAADPSHAAAWNALGALQMQLGRTDEGLQALERAVSISPSTSHLHNNLGYALLLAGRDDAAATSLRRAVELDGSNRRAWSNLATAYRRQGALDQAEFADARASGRWPAATPAPAQAAASLQAAPSAPAITAAHTAQPSTPAAPALGAASAPQTSPTVPAITIGTVTADPSPTVTPIAALVPTPPPAPETVAPAKPLTTSVEASTAALGFATVAPTMVKAAAPLMVSTTPRATLVKVAENVFELHNGPVPREAAVAEAVAIIAATAPPAPVVAAAPRAVETPAVMPPPAAALAAPAPAARYEISNGHGGEGLARRLAGLLGQQGFARPRLTNQAPYNQAASVIQYRDGYRASAEAFASLLPFRPTVMAAANVDLRADVRLVLGRDLTTSDACAVLGLCTRVARTQAPKIAAARGGAD